MVTGNYSSAFGWGTLYQTLNAFDGNLATMVIPDASQGWTFTPSTPIAGSTIEIYGWNDGCPNNGLVINGNNYGDALGADQTVGQWYTLPYSTLNSIVLAGDGSAGNTHFRLIAIRIDGKLLIQNNQSPPNVPTIASIVRANPSTGFSIVSYTGNYTANATIGHSLNAAPELIICKSRTSSDWWPVYHKSLGNTQAMYLNETNGAANSAMWSNTSPTTQVFTVGENDNTNKNNADIIAYCFTPVEGYSAFGSYGSSLAFVYTGFRPAFLIIKSTNSNRNWILIDSTRDQFNAADAVLLPNDSASEDDNSVYAVDFLSNGFKIRGSNSQITGDSEYIYAAFAEHPFKTARAR
jgi:hypothetical protein